MIEFTLEELIVRTGASRRNIKYWTALYVLPFRRDGRRNFYPEITERILKGITLLAAHPVFTTAYIRWMVDAALERPAADPARAAALRTGWTAATDAFGITGLLPPALPDVLEKIAPPESPRRSQTVVRAVGNFVPEKTRSRSRDDDALL